MIIPGFTYHEPRTLREACERGKSVGAKGRYLAGGTDLLVDLRRGSCVAEHVIALSSLRELKEIREDGSCLRIGGLATMTEIAGSPIVQRVFPVLQRAALCMGSAQVRNQATIGGNFCAAVPCADTPPVCVAGGASLRIVGTDSERTVSAAEFFVGPRQSVLEAGEILAEILVPFQPKTSGASFQRFSLRRGSALAVASVAARIVMDGRRIADARVVLGAVAPVPWFAAECAASLRDHEPSDELFENAARIAGAEARPITDLRGSEEFRREIVAVLTPRALRDATRRAKDSSMS